MLSGVKKRKKGGKEQVIAKGYVVACRVGTHSQIINIQSEMTQFRGLSTNQAHLSNGGEALQKLQKLQNLQKKKEAKKAYSNIK